MYPFPIREEVWGVILAQEAVTDSETVTVCDGRRLALPVTSAASRRQKMSPDLGSWLTQSPQPLALTHTRTHTRTHTAAHARSR